jgi:hypothetical protein
MNDLSFRTDRLIKEISGNEALFDILDTQAATEMLDWGKAAVISMVHKTSELDDVSADLILVPGTKAIRQAMRAIGNWVSGKYADPPSRIQLRDKLLEYFRTIFGEEMPLLTPENLDEVLNQVDDQQRTPQQLIISLRRLLEDFG